MENFRLSLATSERDLEDISDYLKKSENSLDWSVKNFLSHSSLTLDSTQFVLARKNGIVCGFTVLVRNKVFGVPFENYVDFHRFVDSGHEFSLIMKPLADQPEIAKELIEEAQDFVQSIWGLENIFLMSLSSDSSSESILTSSYESLCAFENVFLKFSESIPQLKLWKIPAQIVEVNKGGLAAKPSYIREYNVESILRNIGGEIVLSRMQKSYLNKHYSYEFFKEKRDGLVLCPLNPREEERTNVSGRAYLWLKNKYIKAQVIDLSKNGIGIVFKEVTYLKPGQKYMIKLEIEQDEYVDLVVLPVRNTSFTHYGFKVIYSKEDLTNNIKTHCPNQQVSQVS